MPDKTRRERIFDALRKPQVFYGYSPLDILKETLYPNFYLSQLAKNRVVTSSSIIKIPKWGEDD